MKITPIFSCILFSKRPAKKCGNKHIEEPPIIPLGSLQKYLGQLFHFQKRQQVVIRVKEQSKIFPSSISDAVFALFHF